MTKFREWVIDNGGYQDVADVLGVSRQIVNFWANGRGFPRAAMMDRIVKLSRGTLSFEDIIESCKKQKAKKAKTLKC